MDELVQHVRELGLSTPDQAPAGSGNSAMSADEAVVCDTSVLAAMVFAEPGSVEAHFLTRSRRLLAPTLLRYEMAHVAVRKMTFAPDEAPQLRKAFAPASACR